MSTTLEQVTKERDTLLEAAKKAASDESCPECWKSFGHIYNRVEGEVAACVENSDCQLYHICKALSDLGHKHDAESKIWFSVTSGMRGYFAVMHDDIEPIQTGFTCKTWAQAKASAIGWAKAEFGDKWQEHCKLREDEL